MVLIITFTQIKTLYLKKVTVFLHFIVLTIRSLKSNIYSYHFMQFHL